MKRVVVKIGSSSLIDKDGKLNQTRIEEVINEMAMLKESNVDPIIVTSGAVAVGANKLQVKPKDIKMKQACAAVGQAILMNGYEKACDMKNLKCAQILLNHDDFDSRNRMLNLENTLNTLIENGVIPIINENDALAVEEIKVGDNDTLSALIAPMANADLLILMSDIDGFYTDNPKTNKEAKLIKIIDVIDENIENMAKGSSSNVGTGGMQTKVKAAKMVTSSGVDMIIMNSEKITSLRNAFTSEFEGTKFVASKERISARIQWIKYKTKSKGSIVLNEGASNAILERKSVLAKGIIGVNKKFNVGDVIDIVYNDIVIAKGITNYSNEEVNKIKGKDSKLFNEILGYQGKAVVIHANDIALM